MKDSQQCFCVSWCTDSVRLGVYAAWRNFCQTLLIFLLSLRLLGPDCTEMKKVKEISDSCKYRQNTPFKNSRNSFEFSPIVVFSFILSTKITVIELGESPGYISSRTSSTLTTLHLACVWRVSKSRKELQSILDIFSMQFCLRLSLCTETWSETRWNI